MADVWAEDPVGGRILAVCSEILGWDVRERCRDPEALKLTQVAQPGLFACDLAAFSVLEELGVYCHAVAGHSLGEYVALVASEAVSLEDGLRALAVRAEAMGAASAQNPGAMTALVGASPEQAAEICQVAGRGDVLAVANENGPRQTVLSGSVAAVERAEKLARGRGIRAVRLNVAGAFHSPLMEPALPAVREAIARMPFQTPRVAVVPNASGILTTSPIALRDLLSRHLVSPVRWESSLHSMARDGVELFVEAGPGDVLAKLTRRAIPGAQVRGVGSPEQARQVAEEVLERHGAGHDAGERSDDDG